MARLLFGIHPVAEALRAGRVSALFILEGDSSAALRPVLDAAQKAGVQPIPRSRFALDELSRRAVHQGAVAVSGEYPYVELAAILDHARASQRPPLVLVLDGVQDPQNLGAIIRTAHVVGVHGVVIPRDRAVTVTPTVVKTSAGATEHTKIALVTNVARALEEIKAAGLWVAGAVADGAEAPWKVDLKGPIALVLGAEGKGIRPLVLRGCDLLIKIPMVGKVASLNVGAAGAILLYETLRQRSH